MARAPSYHIISHISSKVLALWLGSSFASEHSLSPLSFWCENHGESRVMPFVLKQASAHVCNVSGLTQSSLGPSWRRELWSNGPWWDGDPRCFKKHQRSCHADLIATPASKHKAVPVKTGVGVSILHAWWGRWLWTSDSTSTSPSPFPCPPPTSQTLYCLFQSG